MRSIPIDTSAMTFTVIAVVESLDGDGRQKMTTDRVPLWVVQTLVQHDGRPEVLEVRIPSNAQPKPPVMGPVSFLGLKATPWSIEGRSGVSYSATAVNAVNAAPVRNGAKPEPAQASA